MSNSLIHHRLTEEHLLILGPQVAGCRIFCNAAQRSILIGNRIMRMTPTEYQVALPLLRQREQWERGQAPLWTTFATLSAITGIRDAELLNRHITNASNKLAPSGIGFVRIRTPQHGDIYQTLLHERDIAPRRGKVHE